MQEREREEERGGERRWERCRGEEGGGIYMGKPGDDLSTGVRVVIGTCLFDPSAKGSGTAEEPLGHV